MFLFSIKHQVSLPRRLTRAHNLRMSHILAKWAPPSFNSPPCKLQTALAFSLAFACWFGAKKALPDPKEEVLLKNREVRSAVGIWGALYGIPMTPPCIASSFRGLLRL